MEIKLNIEKKHLWLIASLLLVVFVIAQSDDPDYFGHDSGDVRVTWGTETQLLQSVVDNLKNTITSMQNQMNAQAERISQLQQTGFLEIIEVPVRIEGDIGGDHRSIRVIYKGEQYGSGNLGSGMDQKEIDWFLMNNPRFVGERNLIVSAFWTELKRDNNCLEAEWVLNEGGHVITRNDWTYESGQLHSAIAKARCYRLKRQPTDITLYVGWNTQRAENEPYCWIINQDGSCGRQITNLEEGKRTPNDCIDMTVNQEYGSEYSTTGRDDMGPTGSASAPCNIEHSNKYKVRLTKEQVLYAGWDNDRDEWPDCWVLYGPSFDQCGAAWDLVPEDTKEKCADVVTMHLRPGWQVAGPIVSEGSGRATEPPYTNGYCDDTTSDKIRFKVRPPAPT